MKVSWCFGFIGSCGSRLSSTADRATHQSTNRALGRHRRHARNDRTIAHLDIVTPLLGAVGIAQAIVHGNGADRSRKRIITLHRGSARPQDRGIVAVAGPAPYPAPRRRTLHRRDAHARPEVRDDIRGWRLGRIITVVDRGFSPAENLAYLRAGLQEPPRSRTRVPT